MKNEDKKCICQKCKQEGNAVIWHEISIYEKKKAMDTSLFKWTCPNCGHIYKFIYPCTYTDDVKKFIVRFQGQDINFGQDKNNQGYIKRD